MSAVRQLLDSLAPGSKARGRIVAGTLAAGGEIALPYLALRGRRDGPCLWINGNVHGDEINGTLAAIRFFQRLDAGEVRGRVVVTPTANPLAFDAREKHTPLDGLDLDQAFPGRAGGFASDRIAHALFAEVRACADLVVSLHAIGWIMDAQPYAVYKLHPGGAVSESELLAYLAYFRPALACRMSVEPGAGELPGNVAGALDYQFLATGKPAFMVEIGSARQAQADYIERAVAGLGGVAAKLGLLDAAGIEPAARLIRVTRRAHVTCGRAGLLHPLAAPGSHRAAGQALAEVMDLYGDVVERVALDDPCIVIGIRREPVVHTGDRVAFVAREWDEVAV
ncbi:MAG TPA: M14 family metallopeptidase [Burkholderiales bacterium]|nr:M14 family metallopeptidase [Burkholderiales bacterium]